MAESNSEVKPLGGEIINEDAGDHRLVTFVASLIHKHIHTLVLHCHPHHGGHHGGYIVWPE